jgi:Protein of unknown function (DUF3568)
MRVIGRAVVLSALCSTLSGCAALAVALVGAGATAGASYQLSGINYRTFTEPMKKVESAVHAALTRMGITVDSTELVENVTVIKASTPARSIELKLEPLTAQTTRMRSVAYEGIVVDGATGNEIINQTEVTLVTNGNGHKTNGNGNGNGTGNGRQKTAAKRGT